MTFRELFENRTPVIVALHLPPFPGGPGGGWAIADIERFAVENAGVFAAGGADAVVVQDQTVSLAGDGDPAIVAPFAIAARAVRAAFPALPLGIIANHHGSRTPLAVAKAADAQFVRLKVYVGAMVKAGGIEQGCAVDALRYRAEIGADEVAIVADVFDRTGTPLGDATIEEASDWAARIGRADALVLTGRDFESSLDLIDRVRAARVGRPLLLGGGATTGNVATAVRHADGVIVSSALKRTEGTAEEIRARPWDERVVAQFVKACREARAQAAPVRKWVDA